MNDRTKYLFISFSLLLFLIAMMVWYANTHSTFRPAESDFSVSRGFEISRIHIVDPVEGQNIELRTDASGQWMLNDNFYANESAIMQLVDVMRKLTIRQPVSVEMHENINRMLDSAGIRVTVYARDHHIKIAGINLLPYQRVVQSFLVGSDTPDGLSSYMKKEGASMVFMIHVPGLESGLYRYFEPNINEWRDPVVIDVAMENIVFVKTLVKGNPEESFIISREGGGLFSFHDPETGLLIMDLDVDTARVLRYLSSFQGLHYEKLVDESDPDTSIESMFNDPFMEIMVNPLHGDEIAITVFRRKPMEENQLAGITTGFDPNRFFIQFSDGEVAIAQYYVFNRILRPLSFFRR
jgi:hypothetical protein